MHRRRLLVAAAFAVWMHSCATYAQSKIDVPAKVELGEPIVASVQLPAGGKVAWKAGAGVALIDAGEGKAYLWAKPGTAKIEAVLVSVADGQLGALEWLEATFEVAGVIPPPVPPTPVPPTPVPPTPSGKRQVVIIRESADDTAAFKRLTVSLQDGAELRWLKDRGHPAPLIFDDDDLPASLKAKLNQLPALPAVCVIDTGNGMVLTAETLAAAATAADVTALVQRTGG